MGTSLKTAGVSTLTSTFVSARMAAPPVDESHMSSARIWMVKRSGIGALGGASERLQGHAAGPRGPRSALEPSGPLRQREGRLEPSASDSAAARTTSLTRLRYAKVKSVVEARGLDQSHGLR